MSKLEELIPELCPDGVEWKPLNEVASCSRTRIEASDVNGGTCVGVENLLPEKQGKAASSCVPEEGRSVKYETGDILIGNIRPYFKKIWLAGVAGGTNGDALVVQIVDKSALLPEWLHYVLSSDTFFAYDMQNAKGAKRPRGGRDAVMEYVVPIPPLEIQREVARILDNFTEPAAEYTPLHSRKQECQSEAALEADCSNLLQQEGYARVHIDSEEELIETLRKRHEKLNRYALTDNEWN